MDREALLLHCCCGPCASAVAPAWRAAGLEPTALFFNPNIQPAIEYERRLEAMRQLADALSLPLEVRELAAPGAGASPGPWRPPDAPPPLRCGACIGLRMQMAARCAAEAGLGRFATTLAVSPYQPHEVIRAEGEAAADRWGVEFLYVDQRAAYRQIAPAARRLGLYRQRYCGCVASKWEAWNERRARRRGPRTP